MKGRAGSVAGLLALLFCSGQGAWAAGACGADDLRAFRALVFERLAAEGRVSEFHRAYAWLPERVLQRAPVGDCRDWAKKSANPEQMFTPCEEVKRAAESLRERFRCGR